MPVPYNESSFSEAVQALRRGLKLWCPKEKWGADPASLIAKQVDQLCMQLDALMAAQI